MIYNPYNSLYYNYAMMYSGLSHLFSENFILKIYFYATFLAGYERFFFDGVKRGMLQVGALRKTMLFQIEERVQLL